MSSVFRSGKGFGDLTVLYPMDNRLLWMAEPKIGDERW
jgi:hypothetical protein